MGKCSHGNMTAHGRECPWCKNTDLEAELRWLQNKHVRVCSSESKLKAEVAGYELQVNSMVMSHREQLAELEAENTELKHDKKVLRKLLKTHYSDWRIEEALQPPKEGSSDD